MRALRWILGVLGVLVLLVVVSAVAALVWLRAEPGQAWLLAQARALGKPHAGSLEIARLKTDLSSSLKLGGVVVRDAAGREIVGLDSLEVDFSLRALLKRTVRIHRVEVRGLRADLTVTEAGIDLAQLWVDPSVAAAPATPWSGLPIDLLIEGIDAEASHIGVRSGADAFALNNTTLSGGLGFEGERVYVATLALNAVSMPDLGPVALRADLSYDPGNLVVETLELEVGVQHVRIAGALDGLDSVETTVGVHVQALHVEPELLPWDLPLVGEFDVTGEVTGSLEAPGVELVITTPGGPVEVNAALDLRPARPTWTAAVRTEDVALDAFIRDLAPTVLGGTLQAEGVGLGWPDDLDATLIIDEAAEPAPYVGAARVHAVIALEGGVADILALVAATPSGSVSATGRLDLVEESGSAAVTSLDVALADLRRFGVNGLHGSAGFVGEVEGAWGGVAPAATLKGALSGRGVGFETAARVSSFDGPIHVDWANGAGTFSSTLRVRDIRAATARVNRVTLAARGSATQAGALELVATLGAEGLAVGEIVADQAVGKVSVLGDQLVVALDVFSPTRTILGLDGSGDMETRHFELSRLIFSPTDGQTWEGQGTQAATLADDGIQDLRVDITSESAAIRASGSLHTQGAVAMNLEVADFPISLLRFVDPALGGYSGIVGVKAGASGAWSDIHVTMLAVVNELTVPGSVSGLNATLRADSAAQSVVVDASVADAQQTLATLKGTVPLSLEAQRPGLRLTDPVDLVLELPASTADQWNGVIDAVEVPAGRGRGQVMLTGTLLKPEVRLVLAVEAPKPDKRAPWVALDVEASAAGRELELTANLRDGDVDAASLAGTATVEIERIAASLLNEGPVVNLADPTSWTGALDFLLKPNLALATIRPFVAIPDDVRGRVQGEVRVTGTTSEPVIDASLSVARAQLGALDVTPATLTVAPASGGYEIAADFGFAADGSVKLSAFVPLALRTDSSLAPQLERPGLNIDVGGDGVPLQAVAALWPELQDAEGRLTLGGTVRGSIKQPSGNIKMSAKDASFRLVSTGVAYDQVRFDLTLDPDALRLDALHLRTSNPGEDPEAGIQGTIEGSVQAKLEGTALGEWSGKMQLDRPLISAGDRLLRLASGNISFAGSPPNVRVNGKLAVEEARIHLDDRFFRGPIATTAPSWLRVHRRGEELQAKPPEAPSGIPAWLQLRLGLDLGGTTFLRAELPLTASLGSLLGPFGSITVDTQADGQLLLDLAEGELSVTGEIVPVRGTTVLFGKPFEIRDDSTISFTGNDFTSPVLRLHATYDTRSYGLVEANITGVPEALSVTLSSTEHPSQDDVISLLLIGKPASEMSSGEGAGDGASAAAMSMLLTTVGQTLGREGEKTAAMLITPDLLVVGSDTARVGKRIGRRLFVEVDLDSTADDRTSSYLILTLEYALGGPWETQFTHGTAGEDSLELSWSKRY